MQYIILIVKEISINIYLCSFVWFWKKNSKFDPIWTIVTKRHSI